MGGGDSGGGSSTQYTYTNTVPEIPAELKPLYSQTAKGITDVQKQIPLGGNVTYTQQMLNPAYTQWAAQYGGYNMPQGGTYNPYTTYYDPTTMTYVTNPNQASMGFSQANKNPQFLWPNEWAGGEDQYQMIIPPAPPMYIDDPSSAVQQSTNFLQPQVQQIAPMTGLEQQAVGMTPQLADMPLSEMLGLMYAGQAGNVPSSEQYWGPGAFEASPYYNTAYGAYQSGVLPTIENQMALSGLGRSSSAANAMAQGWSQMLPQALSQYATQYVEPQLGRAENAIARMTSLVPSLTAMSAQDTARMAQAINAMLQGGGLERSIQQAQYDAQYADVLRRQALAEEALFTPMGLLFPSSIGQNQTGVSTGTTETSGGGGGLFK